MLKKITRGLMAILISTTISFPCWASSLPKEEAGSGSKASWHGYGELHYNLPAGDPAKMDFHRMVWGLTYPISDQISLHSEIDFEHGANAADLELEYTYLDFLVNPAFNLRAGSMLMPVGSLNEFHEPTLFYSVERPVVQKDVIPTTWSEGGFGIFGASAVGLKYRLYLVSSLDAAKFTEKSGIRDGRGKVKDQKTDALGMVVRTEYTASPGLDF